MEIATAFGLAMTRGGGMAWAGWMERCAVLGVRGGGAGRGYSRNVRPNWNCRGGLALRLTITPVAADPTCIWLLWLALLA